MNRTEAIEQFVKDFIDGGCEGYEDFPSLDHLTREAKAIIARPADPAPYVFVSIEGGMYRYHQSYPGVGEPVFDALDFDREGEDEDSRAEWLEYANEVIARLRERDPGIADVVAEDVRGVR